MKSPLALQWASTWCCVLLTNTLNTHPVPLPANSVNNSGADNPGVDSTKPMEPLLSPQ